MAKQAPDYSFEREGVTLRDWLWRLLDEDRQTRVAAGDVLQAMETGRRSIHTESTDLQPLPDVVAQQGRFEQAVRLAVDASDFGTADFVRKLIAYRLALKRDWLRRVDQLCERDSKRDEQFDRLAEKLTEKIGSDAAASEKQHARERLARLSAIYICGAGDSESDPCADAESLSSAGLASHRIFGILNRELLAAPDALQSMLETENRGQLRSDALAALARIGPPAIAFAAQMIEEIEALPHPSKDKYPTFDAARALGAIGRGDAVTVASIVRLLASDSPSQRVAAAETAEYLGTDVCGREEEIVTLLTPMLNLDNEYYAALPAMASVGRHLVHARFQVIAIAKARPPKWRTAPWPEGTNEKYDQTMFERGVAISAMHYLRDYADECLPVLIDAMDTFEEFDPDEMYDGPQGRICTVLASFGPKAAPAANAVVSLLSFDSDEPLTSILEALAEMGPRAHYVIPKLLAFREKYMGDEPLEDLDTVLVNRYDDFVGWAIQRIRGQQEGNGL